MGSILSNRLRENRTTVCVSYATVCVAACMANAG